MTAQLHIRDVEVDQELPPLVKRPTTRQLAMYAGASGDFYEIHYDKEFAQSEGLPGVILHGALKNAFLAQLMTDWIGPAGELRSLSVRYRDMDVPGDTLTCKGRVLEKDDAAGTARCEIWLENGDGTKTTTGEALVSLPV
ncbi:MAG: MaoC/PaaZ C-terminal domain-containing protein [Dehalococcoidia bacterium]